MLPMRINETDDSMQICFYPVSKWIWGTIFTIIFGGFLLFTLWSAWETPHHFIGSSGQGLYDRALSILVFVMLVGFLFGMVLMFGSMALSATIITTIDRSARTIFIRRRKLFGGSEDRYLFSQVSRFDREIVQGESRSEYVALVLANEDMVRIETNREADPQQLIDRLNQYLKSAQNA